MSIGSTYAPVLFAANGSTVTFTPSWHARLTTDLAVAIFNPTTNVYVSPAPVNGGSGTYDYSVSASTDSRTGEAYGISVTFNNAPPSGDIVVITRKTSQAQSLTLLNGGPFPSGATEATLDQLMMLAQEATAILNRVPRMPLVDNLTANDLPPAAARANKVAAFDGNGQLTSGSYNASVPNWVINASPGLFILQGQDLDLNAKSLFVQWGVAKTTADSTGLAAQLWHFPTTFPNACLWLSGPTYCVPPTGHEKLTLPVIGSTAGFAFGAKNCAPHAAVKFPFLAIGW